MNRHAETDAYSQAGDWVVGTARRNPEALLLLAAGCVLLMRSGGRPTVRASSRSPSNEYGSDHRSYSSGSSRQRSGVREGLLRAAETAADYASDIKERVSDTAGSYADSVSEFAEDARRNVSERSMHLKRQAQSTMQAGVNRVLGDQPLAVAIAGLAAGAIVAAAFPTTDIEGRTLGGAREALTEGASRAGDAVMGAAGKAGEHLKTAAQERGFTAEGLKDLAGEVTDTFTDAVSGKSEGHGGAPIVPDSSASGSLSDKSSGSGLGGRDTSRSSNLAGARTEPSGRGNR
jgi:hypothetical protein